MDLAVAARSAIDKVVGSGAIEKAIEEALAKTMIKVVEEQLGKYSDFGKMVEEAVKKALAIRGQIDLPSYNDAIVKIVRLQVEAATSKVMKQEIGTHIERLLEPAPEEIKLSELVRQYVEQQKHEAKLECECDGSGEVHVTVEESGTRGWKYIRLSPKVGGKPADVTIAVTDKGYVYRVSFKNQDVERQLFAGPLYDFERLVFQLRCAGSRIIFDEEPADLETAWDVVEID